MRRAIDDLPSSIARNAPRVAAALTLTAWWLGCNAKAEPVKPPPTRVSNPQSAPPPGSLISSFESGPDSSFHTQWRAIDDHPAGGVSSAHSECVAGGAAG